MPSPPTSWYTEVLWCVRFAFGLYPSASHVGPGQPAAPAPFRVSEMPVAAWRDTDQQPFADWRKSLVARAHLLLAHRPGFVNLETHAAGQRHRHLVVLGRAYRATGDERYAAELIAQLVSWLDQSPFRGTNWGSPIEFGIRVINWVWALDLIRESAAWTTAPHQRIRHALYLHLWKITRRYSKGSSSSNHLISEAAGVFVATAYFPDLPNAAAWHEESRAALERELLPQTHPDGATREQATSDLMCVLQLLLATGMVSRKLKRDVAPVYWAHVELMCEHLATLVEAGRVPNLGDADDGLVLDLGDGGADGAGMMSAGAALFGRSDFARIAGGWRSWSYWLLGPESDVVAAMHRPTGPSGGERTVPSCDR